MKPDGRKSLPGPKSGNFLDTIRESVQTYMGLQGDKLDRGITVRDLANAGLIDVSKSYLMGGTRNPIGRVNTIIGTPGPGGTIIIGGDAYEPDLTPPPTPTGFAASAGISFIYVECANQVYTQGHGHAVTKLYGAKRAGDAPAPTFAQAVELSSFAGTVYAYPTDPSTTWHLWIKWVTKDGVESATPAGGTNGLVAVTGQDVTTLLNALTAAAQSPSAPYTRISFRANLFYVSSETSNDPLFSVVTSPITVNGVPVPAGTYMKDAFIQNGTITNLKVANAAIDNVKIANVSADKLIAGTIAVGQYIQSTNYVAGTSGWKINGIGNVEFNNAVFRGQAFIGDGSVGGILITPTTMRSSNYDGAGNGFRIGADGKLDLPGGSVSALQLNVGAGANLLENSTWMDVTGNPAGTAVPTGWQFGTNEGILNRYQTPNGAFPDYCPPGQFGFCMETPLGPHTGGYGLIQGRFPVFPGRRYEATVYAGAHRCLVSTDIQWHDGNNNVLGYTSDNAVTNTDEAYGGRLLTQFKRIGCFGTAPNGAAYGYFRILKSSTLSSTSSYAFLTMPFVGEANPRQSGFSPYSPSGLGTRVTPAGITTPSLAALTGVMGDLYAGNVRGGNFTGYAWPGNGGGGFYLGPPGLLLGNANSGRYFQVEESGNIFAPGFTVVNGTLSFQQGNIINSQQIIQGAVSFGISGSGNNSVNIPISVPAGELWNILLIATFGQSNYVSEQIFPNSVNGIRVCSLVNAPGQIRQAAERIIFPFGGPVSFIGPASISSAFQISGGSYNLGANCGYENFAFDTPIYLIGFVFKR